MKLDLQKRLAAKILKCGKDRVKFHPDHLEEIKEAITREDIKKLIEQGVIYKIQKKGISSVRKKKVREQRKKGRRKGHGSRKGKKGARMPSKQLWMQRIRAQRKLLKLLKEEGLIDSKVYRILYRKSKGGVFRSKRHLLMFINENNLAKKKIGEEYLKKSTKNK